MRPRGLLPGCIFYKAAEFMRPDLSGRCQGFLKQSLQVTSGLHQSTLKNVCREKKGEAEPFSSPSPFQNDIKLSGGAKKAGHAAQK